MSITIKQYPIKIGEGGGGKCLVYYSEKYKKKVVEKTVGDNFIRTKKENRNRLQTLITNYNSNEASLKKEMIYMLLMKTVKLDCCVEILGFESNPFRIIMEYYEGGDLRKILDTYDVPDGDKMTMISQILIALKRIHENKFIHGDLKCANIFLVNKYIPGDYKKIKIKIGDFGLSEIGGDLVRGGTFGFMAPEVPFIGGSFESDIYSIGKVMLEIMTQYPVKIIQAIDSSNIYSLKNKLPAFLNITQFNYIVISCLNINYKKRPSANEVFKLFHVLIPLWLFGEDENQIILQKYRLGEAIPVDTHPHPLILSSCEMRNYQGDGWYCSICNNQKTPFFNNMFSFHCKKCEYDLCYSCMEIHDYRNVNDEMLKHAHKGKKVYVTMHPHYLLLSGKEDRYIGKDYIWNCDICKVEACDSIYSFHCKQCGYDVCSKCFEKYFQVREKGCCFIF